VTKHFQWDAHGQVTESVVDPGGLSLRSRFEYDPSGRLGRYIDPTATVTVWERDAIGRVIAVKLPGGTTWKYSFDAGTRICEEQTPSGNRIRTELVGVEGRLARVTSVAAPGQESVAPWELAFDGLGRLVRASTGVDSVHRQYDS